MSTPAALDVECDRLHPVLRVSDVLAAAEFYTTRLGFKPGFTWGNPPTFAGVNLGEVQLFLEQGPPHPKGSSVAFVVGDADALFEFQRANGVEVLLAPEDRDYGLRDYRVRDPDGNELSFGHPTNNVGPPIAIERVDVPVRLEKRLAALLDDLAKRKRMSLSSCLEETLLHTLDGVGPHTRSDLAFIQTLKQKHGIDYDSHGSYGFVER